MRSSTSSSDLNSRAARWHLPLLGGVLVALVLFVLLESAVRMLGFVPGVRDGAPLWGLERMRARGDAIVLVGDSRILLGIDTQQLSRLAGRPVVQLAIDGQSYQPVLADLAADDDFTGTVLVSVADSNLTTNSARARAASWVRHWHQHMRTSASARADAWLARLLQSHSAWYTAEQPWDLLLQLVANGRRIAIHLETLPGRSRLADFGPARVQYDYYVRRVLGDMGRPVALDDVRTLGEFEARINQQLAREHPLTLANFSTNTAQTAAWAQAIRQRGGNVILLRMPSTRLVRRMEEVRTPRALYWDRFVAGAGIPALHFEDVPTLARYRLPDGSHLDRRDVTRFTTDLFQALDERGLVPRASP